MSSQWLDSKPPNSEQIPAVRSLLKDFSAEALGELRTWLEQNPPAISIQSIIGYQTNTVRVYKKSTATVDVQNTVSETSVLTDDAGAIVQIPGGTLGTSGQVRVTMMFDWLNNTGVNKTSTFKIKWGGTTIYQDTDVAASSAVRRAVRLELELSSVAATGTQYLSGLWFVSNTAAPVTGIGSIGTTGDRATPISSSGTVAVDSTISQPLDVTVTHPTASASLSFRRQFYMVEFL